MFRFNPDRLKELAPEQFKTISAKLPPQDDMIKDIIYQERHFPLRTVQGKRLSKYIFYSSFSLLTFATKK
ncbi:hypothetical protein I160019C6_18090 [Bacteroides uniformis]